MGGSWVNSMLSWVTSSGALPSPALVGNHEYFVNIATFSGSGMPTFAMSFLKMVPAGNSRVSMVCFAGSSKLPHVR